MEPAFVEGDRVLTINWSKLVVGSVVVVKYKDMYLLKRVASIRKGKYIIKGDNYKLTSKPVMVNRKDIVGRVFLKY